MVLDMHRQESNEMLNMRVGTHHNRLAKLLQDEGLAQLSSRLGMLGHPVAQELLLVNSDLLLGPGGKPQIGPEMDSSEVDLGMSHVTGEVLARDTGPAIAGVVLYPDIVLAPVTLVPNCHHVHRVDCLGVVSHHLNPVLQVARNGVRGVCT